MITLNSNILNINVQVKSVSAAWNEVRKIRNTTEPQVLNDTVLTVTADEGTDLSRIPAKILFLLNKNGKIEFKDLAKVQARRAAKKAKTKVETETEKSAEIAEALNNLSIQMAEELNEN